jgi:hypothetical protein
LPPASYLPAGSELAPQTGITVILACPAQVKPLSKAELQGLMYNDKEKSPAFKIDICQNYSD